MLSGNKGFALIAVIAVLAVLAGLGFYLFHGTKESKPDTMTDFSNSQKHSVYGQAMDAANAVSCQNNVGQARNSINMYIQSNEAAPASLAEAGVSDSMTKCPVSGEAYTYDSQTGTVKCPTHPDF